MEKVAVERLRRAIAESQHVGAVGDWFSEPEEEGPRRACLAERLAHWTRVLRALEGF